jgi:hypothetical protein
VPGEDLVQRTVDDALVLDAHDHPFGTGSPSDETPAARLTYVTQPQSGCATNHHRDSS